MLYYEHEWSEREWDDTTNFDSHKYPEKKLGLYTALYQAIVAHNNNEIIKLKKTLNLSDKYWTNKLILEKIYAVQEESSVIDYLLKLPTLNDFEKHCKNNRNYQPSA